MADLEPPNEPVNSLVFRWLIQACRRKLRIPATGLTQTTKHFERYTKVNHEIIRRLLLGLTADHHETTFTKLLEYFRVAEPRLPANTFAFSSYTEFLEAIALIGFGDVRADTFSFHLPDYDDRIHNLEKWLKGTFVSYRYAFEREDKGLVSREVLHIDDDFEFQMSFRANIESRDVPAYTFDGKVIPIGTSLCLLGFNTGIGKDRARTLLLHNQPEPRLSICRFGILTSTRLRPDLQPVAASTLLVKTAEIIADVEQFRQDVTCNEAYETLIPQDFGPDPERQNWIKAFLDNRPAGTHADPVLRDLEDIPETLAAPEATLKLNLKRFNQIMPGLVQAVADDDRADAPFKKDWKPPIK